jgi:TRAP-type C4-dicarboxylate transport system permease small subunit
MTLVCFCITVVISAVKSIAFIDMDQSVHLSCAGYWFSYSILNSIAFSGLVIRGWVLIFIFNLEQFFLRISRRKVTDVTVDDQVNMLDGKERENGGWYLSNRRWIKSRFLVISILSVSSVLLITIGGYFATTPEAVQGNITTTNFPLAGEDSNSFTCTCLSDHASYLFVDIPVGILIVAATVMLLRGLNDVYENFMLKDEIFNIGKLLVGTGVAITILFLPFVKKPIMNYDPALMSILHFLVRYFFPALAFLWITAGNTIKISYQFYESDLDRKVQVDSMISNLIPQKPTLNEMREEMFKMLFDKPGYSLFEEFLVKEFSVENIMFWKEAKDFREYASKLEANLSSQQNDKKSNDDVMSPDDIQQMIDTRAQKLFKNFCSDEASFLINIPYAIHNRLRMTFVKAEVRHLLALTRNFSNKMMTKSNSRITTERESSIRPIPTPQPRKITSDTFTEALNEVTNLMCSDSFRRFRMTDEYRQYVLNRYNREMEAISSGNVINAQEVFIASSRESHAESV